MKKFKNNLIFIVEDNEIYSLMIDYVLSNEYNYRFRCFTNGEECIENLSLHPDMIIMDYHLPGMNGKETFLEIKKYDAGIPVIILTADHDINIARELLKEGVYDYLLKEQDSVTQIKDNIDAVFDKTKNKNRNAFQSMFDRVSGGFFN